MVTMYTDGACSGNPGPGGWGVLLMCDGHTKELCGGEVDTTNNRMELLAAIKGLEALKRVCQVDLFTDSKYVQMGINQWIVDWKRRGWRTASNGPVKNVDLWRELEELASQHKVAWHWVKGHNDNEGNERADFLARKGLKNV